QVLIQSRLRSSGDMGEPSERQKTSASAPGLARPKASRNSSCPAPVLTQHGHAAGRQRDGALAALGLGRIISEPGLGLVEAALDAHTGAVKVAIGPLHRFTPPGRHSYC